MPMLAVWLRRRAKEIDMSMDRCRRCDKLVDTDFDLECYDKQDQCVCESCRDKEEMEKDEESHYAFFESPVCDEEEPDCECGAGAGPNDFVAWQRCSLAGTEHCDFACPFSRAVRAKLRELEEKET